MDRSSDRDAIEWAKAIKQRDNYVCKLCGRYGVYLHSHHLNSYDFFETERYKLSNGICICEVDHAIFHSIYGKGHNTIYQFKQFKKTVEAFKKAILGSLKF